MKKFITAALLIALLLPVVAWGAGSASSCSATPPNDDNVVFVTCTYTGDDATGAIPDATFYAQGYVTLGEVYTGTTQPTALYDITVTRVVGTDTPDIFGGELTNLSQAGGEQKAPLVGSAAGYPRYVDATLTVNWDNNSVISAVGGVIFTIEKPR